MEKQNSSAVRVAIDKVDDLLIFNGYKSGDYITISSYVSEASDAWLKNLKMAKTIDVKFYDDKGNLSHKNSYKVTFDSLSYNWSWNDDPATPLIYMIQYFITEGM